MNFNDARFQTLWESFNRSTGVCTDSRKVAPGNLFFALRGDSFDGNLFAQSALEQGAICAVVNDEAPYGWGAETIPPEVKAAILPVPDPLKALQLLACRHRSQFNIPVIALTGTNGKTTTKELIREVLAKKYNVSATEGNLNNSIGVPLTLFNLSAETEIAVIEMGASHPGDIKELVEIALPTYGLITNVGKAHLLGFGSFDGVKKTKGELYDYLQRTADRAFYNIDNPYLREMISLRPDLNTIPYGLNYQGGEVLPVTESDPFLRLEIEGRVISTHLVGSYNADNVMTALAVGRHFGVSLEDAAAAISSYFPTNNRSELRKTANNLLVIDAYNANPTSMKASLENFEETAFPNKMLILGDMRELGMDSAKEHREIIELIKSMHVVQTILVGDEFGALKSENHNDMRTLFFHSSEELKSYLKENPLKGYTLLIKGSNGIKLQSVVDWL